MSDQGSSSPNPFQPASRDAVRPQPTGPRVQSPYGSCIKCGYALTGLQLGGICAECGTPLADSLRGTLLQFTGREYLTTLGKGLSFVLNGILVLVLVTMAVVGGSILAGQGYANLQTVQLLGTIATATVSFAILWGYWMFTELDPDAVNLEEQRSAGNTARTCVLVQAGTTLLSLGLQVYISIARPPGTTTASQAFDSTMVIVSLAVGLVAMIAWTIQIIALMRYLRLLGRRVPDAHIDNRAKTYMWLLPVLYTVGMLACGLGPLVALVLYWNILDRFRKHVKSILATGTPATLTKMSVGG